MKTYKIPTDFGNWYTTVPNAVFLDIINGTQFERTNKNGNVIKERLSNIDLLTYIGLRAAIGKNVLSMSCYVSVKNLAENINVNEKTVSRSLLRLEAAGHIQRVETVRNTKTILLTFRSEKGLFVREEKIETKKPSTTPSWRRNYYLEKQKKTENSKNPKETNNENLGDYKYESEDEYNFNDDMNGDNDHGEDRDIFSDPPF